MSFEGRWIFDETENRAKFVEFPKIKHPSEEVPCPWDREAYRGPHDDPISIRDVKNEVYRSCSREFKRIFGILKENHDIDVFLKYLAIYVEFFLKAVEFVLLRRDIFKEFEDTIMRSELSDMEERKISAQLSHRRMLLAREFSRLLLGQIFVSKHFLSSNANGIQHYESFLAFIIRFAWIAFNRRAEETISHEIQRLFRSFHFNKKQAGPSIFSAREKQILYGPKEPHERCFYHAISPLTAELAQVSRAEKELLWIGDGKYVGPSKYMSKLEKPYITSATQLFLADEQAGILGHPKRLYNAHLHRDYTLERSEKFSEKYDPYRLRRRQFIETSKDISLEGNPEGYPKIQLRRKKQ